MKIEAQKDSPEICFDTENGFFSLKGDSFPENSFDFYEPLIQKLEEYLEKSDTLNAEFELVYFNSGTSKALYDIFDLLDSAKEAGKSIDISWIYHPENESAKEAGEDFSEEYEELKIKLVEK